MTAKLVCALHAAIAVDRASHCARKAPSDGVSNEADRIPGVWHVTENFYVGLGM